jgi:hypothetical protein
MFVLLSWWWGCFRQWTVSPISKIECRQLVTTDHYLRMINCKDIVLKTNT